MVRRRKLTLYERTRRPRAVSAARGRRFDDQAVTYFVSVAIAAAAMVMAAMAGS